VSNLIKSIFESEGSVVNITQKIISLTNGITARAAFGKRNRHEKVFISAMEEILRLFGGFCIADLYPSIKMLQMLSLSKNQLVKLQREFDIIMQDIIDDHKCSHKEASKEDDLVDVLLKIQRENDRSQHVLTDENIKSIIQVSLQPNMLVYFTI
jgi:hypothetical protein